MSNFWTKFNLKYFFNYTFNIWPAEHYKLSCSSSAPAPGKNPLFHCLRAPASAPLQSPAFMSFSTIHIWKNKNATAATKNTCNVYNKTEVNIRIAQLWFWNFRSEDFSWTRWCHLISHNEYWSSSKYQKDHVEDRNQPIKSAVSAPHRSVFEIRRNFRINPTLYTP